MLNGPRNIADEAFAPCHENAAPRPRCPPTNTATPKTRHPVQLNIIVNVTGFRLRRNGYGATRVKGEKKTLKAEGFLRRPPKRSFDEAQWRNLAVDSVFPDLSGHP
jgi:hypothetical protein